MSSLGAGGAGSLPGSGSATGALNGILGAAGAAASSTTRGALLDRRVAWPAESPGHRSHGLGDVVRVEWQDDDDVYVDDHDDSALGERIERHHGDRATAVAAAAAAAAAAEHATGLAGRRLGRRELEQLGVGPLPLAALAAAVPLVPSVCWDTSDCADGTAQA